MNNTMGSILEKNSEIIKAKYSDIYEDILGYNIDDSIVGTEDIDGVDVLYVQVNNTVIQLDSMVDTRAIADKWAECIVKKLRYKSNIFVFGFGKGAFIEKLIEKTTDENNIYVYEPDLSIFNDIINKYDISNILRNNRVILSVGGIGKKTAYSQYLNIVDMSDIHNSVIATHPNYPLIFPEKYLEYAQDIEQLVMSETANDGYMRLFSQANTRNIFKNSKDIMESKSIDALIKNTPKDVTAIMVAAGPSLTKNIEELKKAKNKSIIIAVDSALRPLANANIVPDLCVTVDSKKVGAYFDNPLIQNVPMVCIPEAESGNVKSCKGKKFYFASISEFINMFCRDHDVKFPSIQSGGSVANAAVAFAIEAGIKKIVIVGQDLAFTDNKTHAENTVGSSKNLTPEDETRCHMITRDVNGNNIRTSGQFMIYKKWYEEQAIARPDITFINATEGGAKIEGFEHITLREAINRECNVDINYSEIIDRCDDLFDEEIKKEFCEYVKKIPAEFSHIKDLATDGMRTYDRMLDMIYEDKYHSNQFIKLYNRTNSIYNEIANNIYSIFLFDEIRNQASKNDKDLYDDLKDEREELISMCNIGKDTYEQLVKAAKDLTDIYYDSVAIG